MRNFLARCWQYFANIPTCIQHHHYPLTSKGLRDAQDAAALFRVHHVPNEMTLCPCCEHGYIVVEKQFN